MKPTKKRWSTGQEQNIYNLMKIGHTISEIAETYGVSRQIVSSYINSRPELLELKQKRRQAAALAYKRARGLAKKPATGAIPVNGDLSEAIAKFIEANGVRRFRPGESGNFEVMKDFMTERGYKLFGLLGNKAIKVVTPQGRAMRLTRDEFLDLVDRVRIEEGRAPIVLHRSAPTQTRRAA